MKRTRASPSSLNSKVTLYSLVPPSAAAAGPVASTSSLLPSSSSTASSAHIDTKPLRRKSTLLVSSRSYVEEEADDDDLKVKDEPPSGDDQDDFLPDPSSSALPPSRPRSTNKKPKLSTSPTKSTSTSWKAPPEPPNWRAQVDAIREMRKVAPPAPVDEKGCAAAGRQEPDPVRARFSVLISLMLSSQTKGECCEEGTIASRVVPQLERTGLTVSSRPVPSLSVSSSAVDEMTHRAMGKLREALPGGLSAKSLAEADDELIKGAISSV